MQKICNLRQPSELDDEATGGKSQLFNGESQALEQISDFYSGPIRLLWSSRFAQRLGRLRVSKNALHPESRSNVTRPAASRHGKEHSDGPERAYASLAGDPGDHFPRALQV